MKKNCIACIEYWHCKRPQKGITVHDCSFFNDGGAINQKNKKDDFESDPSENSKKQEKIFYHQGSIEVKPRLDRSTERLVLDVEEEITDMIVNLYKDALVALGWTHPEEKTVCSDGKQKDEEKAKKVHTLLPPAYYSRKNRAQEFLKQIDGKKHNEFMGVDVNAFTKEELIKILSLQQREWLESSGFKYEE